MYGAKNGVSDFLPAMRLSLFYLFSAAVLLGNLRSEAQSFYHLSEKGGRFSDAALGITQDREGFMWFATTYGLS